MPNWAPLYCVFPGSDLAGPSLIRSYVIHETAHRFGDELLLWDSWGSIPGADDGDLIDRLAELLVRADAGDRSAEVALAHWYARDARLHPGVSVREHSPFGRPPRVVRLGRPW